MKRFINRFKETIYKDDLKRVLLNGFIQMLLFSILAGALQYFVGELLGVSFGILVYLFAFMIGMKVRDSFFSYHILYPIISIIYFLIGYFIYYLTLYTFIFHDIILAVSYLFNWDGISNIIFGFLNFKTYVDERYIFNNIIDILIFVSAIYTAYTIPNRKNN